MSCFKFGITKAGQNDTKYDRKETIDEIRMAAFKVLKLTEKIAAIKAGKITKKATNEALHQAELDAIDADPTLRFNIIRDTLALNKVFAKFPVFQAIGKGFPTNFSNPEMFEQKLGIKGNSLVFCAIGCLILQSAGYDGTISVLNDVTSAMNVPFMVTLRKLGDQKLKFGIFDKLIRIMDEQGKLAAKALFGGRAYTASEVMESAKAGLNDYLAEFADGSLTLTRATQEFNNAENEISSTPKTVKKREKDEPNPKLAPLLAVKNHKKNIATQIVSDMRRVMSLSGVRIEKVLGPSSSFGLSSDVAFNPDTIVDTAKKAGRDMGKVFSEKTPTESAITLGKVFDHLAGVMAQSSGATDICHAGCCIFLDAFKSNVDKNHQKKFMSVLAYSGDLIDQLAKGISTNAKISTATRLSKITEEASLCYQVGVITIFSQEYIDELPNITGKINAPRMAIKLATR